MSLVSGAGVELLGREHELARLHAFVSEASAGPRALVVEAEPGMGKTTLWREAVAAAERDAVTVLRSRPAPTELHLSFAALADLLAARAGALLPRLPPPQRNALEVALLLDEPAGAPPDARAIGAALLTALRELAAAGPVLVAIDDLHWLDAPSAAALAFAARRFTDEPVRLLLARRSGTEASLVEASLDEGRLERLGLDGLSLGAIHHLLHTRLGVAFPRPVLRRVYAASGGNPFYALELGRSLTGRGVALGSDAALPVPPSLQQLVEERLAALPDPIQRLLPFVAAVPDPRAALLRAAGFGPEVDAAAAAGVLERDGDRVFFAHPLLASAVYARLGDDERRATHLKLSQLVRDDEERALHLALGTAEPADETAAELARAASAARARGASETAARLLEHAARLTPGDRADDTGRRLLGAAEAYGAAGDQPHARALLERMIELVAPGPLRAEALSLLAWINFDDCDLAAAARLSEQALAEAAGEPKLEALIHYRLGDIEGIRGNREATIEHARAAAALAEAAGERGLLALSLAYIGYVETFAGRGVTEASRRAVELEQTLPEFLGQTSPTITLGQLLTYTDELDEGRTWLRQALERADAAGHEQGRAQVLFHLAVLECRAGKLAEARELAVAARDLYRQAGNEQEYASSRSIEAYVAALQGRIDEARTTAERGLEAAERMNDWVFAIHHRGIIGFTALSRGDPHEAHAWLEPATDALLATDTRELSVYPVLQHEIEACVAVGELERADSLSSLLEAIADDNGRTWARAIGARGRGLVLAARGDLNGARRSVERALEAHRSLPQPFELGRTLLALGAIERRAKRKRQAREALERALAVFEELGTPLWAERARGELKRLGLRSAPRELTETESKIATLAAEGLTNREIAAAAFVSEKTVEANLSKAYRKLGVRSRNELTRLLAGDAARARS